MNKDPNQRPIVDEDFAVFYDDEGRASTQKVFTSDDGKQFVIQIDKKTGNEIYVPVEHKRYDSFPEAQLITPTSPTPPINNAVAGLNQEHTQQMMYHQTPMALAPEPLAMRERPKNMRILIPSWIDAKGDLHMPGYVYVEVTPKRWHAGEQANFRPGRIVPLQIQQQSQEESRLQNESNAGLSSLGIKQ